MSFVQISFRSQPDSMSIRHEVDYDLVTYPHQIDIINATTQRHKDENEHDILPGGRRDVAGKSDIVGTSKLIGVMEIPEPPANDNILEQCDFGVVEGSEDGVNEDGAESMAIRGVCFCSVVVIGVVVELGDRIGIRSKKPSQVSDS